MLFTKYNKSIYLNIIKDLIREIFKMSLISFFIFLFIENFNEGFITNYLDINIFLISTIISGILYLIIKQEDDNVEKYSFKIRDYILVIICCIVGSSIIFYNIKEIGKLSYLISVITGIIMFLIFVLLFNKSLNSNGDK